MKEIKILVRIDELGNRNVLASNVKGFNPNSREDQFEILGILEYLKSKQINKIEGMTKSVKFKKNE